MSLMKEYKDRGGGVITCMKEQINGNWYYVCVWPESTSTSYANLVHVYAHDDGREMNYKHPVDIGQNMTKVVVKRKTYQYQSIDMAKFVGEAINDAVCTFERHLEKRDTFQRDITIAIEAAKETHES